ncbi:MAG TPA: aminopeptidase P family protein [Alphaproteobacteria bacterium]|nr:aminopeptidase P family protein [Alphaproteobacteria bacterium]
MSAELADTPATDHATRLKALRAEMLKSGLDGFLVPMADEYQGEYVPDSAQRIAFLSGFTGSAGFIVVFRDKAAFFTDGRYTLQAGKQIDAALFEIHDSAAKSPSDWLAENATPAMRIGFDPWLHTEDGVARLKKAAARAEAKLVAAEHNPLDAIWHDRPAPPAAPIYAYDAAYAGKSAANKRAAIAASLTKNNLAAAVITDPASVAWLLNVRGGDVPNTPLPLSFAIIRDSGKVKWFVDPRKLTTGLEKILGDDVETCDPGLLPDALDWLAKETKAIRVDPAEATYWIVERLRAAGAKLDLGEDPCALPKACKNKAEIEGMKAAHRRDGAALVAFLAWLDGEAPKGTLTEMAAEEKLAQFRATNNLYRGPSFHTISGAGPNGAIVHYRATEATNRTLAPGEFYLLDSGGQYLDGTTDVTRTIAIGKPSAEMRDRFTRVLKGHIALAAVRFPEGTAGAELDALARQYLWEAGLDYGHGTGHGVGSYLGVHEGPQGISKRSHVALRPGMVVSNEPGYYKAGAYGIRIENLQVVTEIAGGNESTRKFHGFETITLAPIDRNAINIEMLTGGERDWLNAYHARVRESLRPMLDESAKRWLEQVTRAI